MRKLTRSLLLSKPIDMSKSTTILMPETKWENLAVNVDSEMEFIENGQIMVSLSTCQFIVDRQ